MAPTGWATAAHARRAALSLAVESSAIAAPTRGRLLVTNDCGSDNVATGPVLHSEEGPPVVVLMSPVTVLRLSIAATVLITVLSLVLRLLDPHPELAEPVLAAKPFPGFYRLLELFHVDREGNLATWVSTCLILVSGLVSSGIARAQWLVRSRWRWHWTLLSMAFVYLSADELAQIHEIAISVMARVVDAQGVLTFAWVVVAAPLVVLFALAYAPFLRAVPRRTGALLAVSGAAYVSGALGMELVGGWVVDAGPGPSSTAYILATTLEEFLEMAAISVCLYALASFPTTPPVDQDPALA